MKRLLKITRNIVLIVPLTLVSIIVIVWIFSPIANEIKLGRIERDLVNTELPIDTTLIETRSHCGNLAGSSNNVELWACILIKSSLSMEELSAHYNDFQIIEVDSVSPPNFNFPNYNNVFENLIDKSDLDGYYAVFVYATPFSVSDIRGH
jgi:hypothetical protein